MGLESHTLPRGPRRALFVATILVGSFLLFLVQPMVARMALPLLGGAPNVWNSAMIVYQVLLLAGYAYAHAIGRLPLRRQAGLHLAALLLAGLMLPIALAHLPPPASGWEVLWVPSLFVMTVGPVFFVMAAQAPLMQRWFAFHPDAGAPWALYAASNLGSFAGLIAYPLLAEPLLSIEAQSRVWALGYAVLVVLVALAAWARWGAPLPLRGVAASGTAQAPHSIDGPHPNPSPEGEGLGGRRILLWLALSAVPSGLMLSTTTHLTTDVFAMPLLWVIPLGLYLLSFVFAFADRRSVAWAVGLFAPVTMLAAGGLAMVSRNSGTMTPAVASVVLLFVVSVALHARLYDARPEPARLTLFYLVMSLGGALGGAFTAIVAPVVFDWVWEHPILVMAAALLLPLPPLLQWRTIAGLDPGLARLAGWVLFAFAAFLAWLLLDVTTGAEPSIYRLFLTVLICGIGMMLLGWRHLYVGVLALLMLAQGGLGTIKASLEQMRTRSYFGIYTVREVPDLKLRMLAHGTTLHGQQSTDPAKAREPMTYYGRRSGAGIALDLVPAMFGNEARVGVVGLGTGTLACYKRPGQRWTFFEIDRAVLDFSADGTFTFLRDCAPDAKVVIGDARLELGTVPPGSFDVLVIDAFSSDAIPLHLLTEEALGIYLRALSRDGVLLVHISNRYIRLEPVIAALARDHGLAARVRNDNPRNHRDLSPSSWVALARDPVRLERLAKARPDEPWDDLGAVAASGWTDDHASILPYVKWDKLMGAQ